VFFCKVFGNDSMKSAALVFRTKLEAEKTILVVSELGELYAASGGARPCVGQSTSGFH
jgi:hypothetical protein